MATPSRTTALNRVQDAVKEMTTQLETVGAMPQETLEDLKSSVDDVRFRLWGLLMDVNSKDYKSSGEQFRLRRMAEICQGMLDDVDAGRLSLGHREAGPLGVVVRELGRRITAAHTQ